ncbi:hypothetical protein TNCV_4180191 [Trichonephila clavipes]|nr:hypothetical protein TNCV_4180191 [Trichonephila clavipes]
MRCNNFLRQYSRLRTTPAHLVAGIPRIVVHKVGGVNESTDCILRSLSIICISSFCDCADGIQSYLRSVRLVSDQKRRVTRELCVHLVEEVGGYEQCAVERYPIRKKVSVRGHNR